MARTASSLVEYVVFSFEANSSLESANEIVPFLRSCCFDPDLEMSEDQPERKQEVMSKRSQSTTFAARVLVEEIYAFPAAYLNVSPEGLDKNENDARISCWCLNRSPTTSKESIRMAYEQKANQIRRLGDQRFIELFLRDCTLQQVFDLSNFDFRGPMSRFVSLPLRKYHQANPSAVLLTLPLEAKSWPDFFELLNVSSDIRHELVRKIKEEIPALLSKKEQLRESLRVVISKEGRLLHVAPSPQIVEEVNKRKLTPNHALTISNVLSGKLFCRSCCTFVLSSLKQRRDRMQWRGKCEHWVKAPRWGDWRVPKETKVLQEELWIKRRDNQEGLLPGSLSRSNSSALSNPMDCEEVPRNYTEKHFSFDEAKALLERCFPEVMSRVPPRMLEKGDLEALKNFVRDKIRLAYDRSTVSNKSSPQEEFQSLGVAAGVIQRFLIRVSDRRRPLSETPFNLCVSFINSVDLYNPYGEVTGDWVEAQIFPDGTTTRPPQQYHYLGDNIPHAGNELEYFRQLYESVREKRTESETFFAHGTEAACIASLLLKPSTDKNSGKKHDFGPGIYCFQESSDGCFLYKAYTYAEDRSLFRDTVTGSASYTSNPAIIIFRIQISPLYKALDANHTALDASEFAPFEEQIDDCETCWERIVGYSRRLELNPPGDFDLIMGTLHDEETTKKTDKKKQSPKQHQQQWQQVCFASNTIIRQLIAAPKMAIELHIDPTKRHRCWEGFADFAKLETERESTSTSTAEAKKEEVALWGSLPN